MLQSLSQSANRHIPTFARGAGHGWAGLQRYLEIDGGQRAAAFAYYAFLSLFPLILLLITVGSLFVESADVQGHVLDLVESYIPLSQADRIAVLEAIIGFIEKRGSAGILALLGVGWTSLRFFQALVRGVNKAWGTVEYSWWRLPLQNLLMILIMAGALLVGMVAQPVLSAAQAYWEKNPFLVPGWALGPVFAAGHEIISILVLLVGLLLFYKMAPRKRPVFHYVWAPALIVALLLQLLQQLFLLYAKNFAQFNAIYGAFGGAIALLMWIYLSGSVIIYGGCLSAALARAEGKSPAEAGEADDLIEPDAGQV